jgi:hypothetical protein
MDMDPALIDSFIYIGSGAIAAGTIHFVFYPPQLEGRTNGNKDG